MERAADETKATKVDPIRALFFGKRVLGIISLDWAKNHMKLTTI